MYMRLIFIQDNVCLIAAAAQQIAKIENKQSFLYDLHSKSAHTKKHQSSLTETKRELHQYKCTARTRKTVQFIKQRGDMREKEMEQYLENREKMGRVFISGWRMQYVNIQESG